jgi:hypothetical protein
MTVHHQTAVPIGWNINAEFGTVDFAHLDFGFARRSRAESCASQEGSD